MEDIDYKKKYELLLDLFGASFGLVINMNDCFAWACAEGCDMEPDDIPIFLPIYEKYGFEALLAYAYLVRDEKESIPMLMQPTYAGYFKNLKEDQAKYCAALSELQDIYEKSKGEFMFSLWWKNNKQKETEKFDLKNKEKNNTVVDK